MAFEDYFAKVSEGARFLKGRIQETPKLFLVLSGGLSDFVDKLECVQTFPSTQIPNFPKAKAEGHNGELIFAKFKNIPVAVMKGRFHYYEGLSAQEIVFPYFVLKELGAEFLVTTNAVGGVRPDLKEGEIMAVTDHINMMGDNPLIGLSVLRPKDQFPSMQNAYDPELLGIAEEVAKAQGLDLKKGVFLANTGPSYETPAEVRMFRMLGADCVGMSSVFEVIAAQFLKMRTIVFNIIANVSADRHPGVMRHDEVLKTMQQAQGNVSKLLEGVVLSIAKLL